MKKQHSTGSRRTTPEQGRQLVPELQAIREEVLAEQYGQASAGTFVELNRRGKRRYAVT
jgi:hypothetical protein